MTGRLPTHVWVDALRRHVNGRGDFAAILKKGERSGGAVLLDVRDRTGLHTLLSRVNLGDGRSEWRALAENEAEDSDKIRKILENQTRYDPDLWLIELDIADAARFIVDLPALS